MKYQQMKIAVTNAINPTQAVTSPEDAGKMVQIFRDNARMFKLPKIQLLKGPHTKPMEKWIQSN